MSSLQMLALLFGFTGVGGIAFMLLGQTPLWRRVSGAHPRQGGHGDRRR